MRRNPRLRGQLFISYLFLLMLTLTVMTLALLLFLFAQPVPPSLTYEKLLTIGRDVLQQAGIGSQQSALTLLQVRNLVQQLPRLAADNDTRILIIDMPTRTIITDSAAVFARTDQIRLTQESYTLQIPLRNRFGIHGEPIFGSLWDKDGSEWFFSGITIIRQNQETSAIVLAEPRPQQTFPLVLDRFRQELALPLCQSAVVGLIVAALLAAFSSRTLVRPLSRLEQAAESVAAGSHDQLVPEDGPVEIRALAAAFNRMSGEVNSTQQAQKEFMANVSHDLKTPLTSIQGYSQAIVDGAAKDPAHAARIIFEEASRLNRMVTELTDLARLQAGQMSMQHRPVDIHQLVLMVGERLSIIARERGLQLHLQSDPVPEVIGDGDRLAQVLTNLVSNAMKYTPSGGEISLRTQVNNGGVEVVVRDTGIGIAPDDLSRIFERFYQVDKARGPRRGTGLGLAITHEIVQAHGGRITVTSAGQGKGSTFTVWLPSAHLNTVVRGQK
ncbi:MAG: HAMP domain-containing histidine kinase [Anaerolineae bacterium]|nr:HAMP domain-containing histidine kinase [Anaerolineae bacterium]